MKSLHVFFAAGLVTASFVPAFAKSPTGHPQDAFAGQWSNVAEKGRGITKLAITHDGDDWEIQAWGACEPTDCDWGKTTLHLVGDSVSAADLPYAIATRDAGFSETHMILRFKGDKLEAESYCVFKDNSGRSNYRSVEKFKRTDSESK